MTVSPGGVPHTPDTVVFRILGPLQVTGLSGPVRIPPGRQEVILAALLLEANRVVSTDYLVDLIWDDEPPDTARTQVQICVSRLRKLFTTAGIAAAITTRPPGYVLRTEGDLVDAAVFARRLADARTLAKRGDAQEAVELLRAAGELWQGDCLSGVSSETLRSKALQLDEERLTAAETRIELELDLGRHHQLVGEIQLLVRVHPLRERLRGQLMLALYRSGRQAEALESYRVGRELLVEELGLEPGGELRGLERAILSGDVPPVRPARPGGGFGSAAAGPGGAYGAGAAGAGADGTRPGTPQAAQGAPGAPGAPFAPSGPHASHGPDSPAAPGGSLHPRAPYSHGTPGDPLGTAAPWGPYDQGAVGSRPGSGDRHAAGAAAPQALYGQGTSGTPLDIPAPRAPQDHGAPLGSTGAQAPHDRGAPSRQGPAGIAPPGQGSLLATPFGGGTAGEAPGGPFDGFPVWSPGAPDRSPGPGTFPAGGPADASPTWGAAPASGYPAAEGAPSWSAGPAGGYGGG
ncbi:BTAD domain-containing putative transcriptional regulator, partial [Streptomyces sp. M-16]|uniref:AfsR/SARP family transcriptional regulator n=1 Tax=Streptomyces sp. M-16 TaxID=3233040 RepID=UPI003F9816F8